MIKQICNFKSLSSAFNMRVARPIINHPFNQARFDSADPGRKLHSRLALGLGGRTKGGCICGVDSAVPFTFRTCVNV